MFQSQQRFPEECEYSNARKMHTRFFPGYSYVSRFPRPLPSSTIWSICTHQFDNVLPPVKSLLIPTSVAAKINHFLTNTTWSVYIKLIISIPNDIVVFDTAILIRGSWKLLWYPCTPFCNIFSWIYLLQLLYKDPIGFSDGASGNKLDPWSLLVHAFLWKLLF